MCNVSLFSYEQNHFAIPPAYIAFCLHMYLFSIYVHLYLESDLDLDFIPVLPLSILNGKW